jgi:hypothetical protein
MIPVFERAKTVHALDRAATVSGTTLCSTSNYQLPSLKFVKGLLLNRNTEMQISENLPYGIAVISAKAFMGLMEDALYGIL